MLVVFAKGCKLHVCETEKIASAVKVDLEIRTECLATIKEDSSFEMFLDFGGSIIEGADVYDSSISFFVIHYDIVKRKVKDSLLREGGYHKLHGDLTCICVSDETLSSFLDEISSKEHELLERQAAQIEEWNVRFARYKQSQY